MAICRWQGSEKSSPTPRVQRKTLPLNTGGLGYPSWLGLYSIWDIKEPTKTTRTQTVNTLSTRIETSVWQQCS